MEISKTIGLYNTVGSAKKNRYDEKIEIPYFKMYSDRIVIYPRVSDYCTVKKPNENSLKNLEGKKYKGNLSITQKRTIKQKLTAWLNSINYYNEKSATRWERKKHYPIFITLTLSQQQKHADTYIRRHMLDLFIKNLKNRSDIKYYFWRAETQQNGNIHYHLIVDKYVRCQEIRDIWNKIQKRYGYLDNYFKENGHYDANSTDVKGVKDINNFVNYILKYCLKDEKNRKIQGKVYGMSEELRTINVYTGILDNSLSDLLIQAKDLNLISTFNNEYFSVIFFNPEFYSTMLYLNLMQTQTSYYYKLYLNLYESQIDDKKIIPSEIEKLKKGVKQLTLYPLSDIIKKQNTYSYIKS